LEAFILFYTLIVLLNAIQRENLVNAERELTHFLPDFIYPCCCWFAAWL